EILGYLPDHTLAEPLNVKSGDEWNRSSKKLEDIVPSDSNKPYDMSEVISEVVDEGRFMELFPSYAENILIGFARLDGQSIGIVANQPKVLAGCLDIDSSVKAARFIRTCDIFNIPFVHSDLHDVLDYDSYKTELFEGGVLQIGIANEGEECFDLPESSPDYGENIAAYYYWIFPGLMLNFYPWGLSVNIVNPISVNKTKIIYHGFVGDKSLLGKGAGGDLDKVELEDQDIVEATQRGVSSKSYDRGRYSPSKEKGVHHFHKILTDS
ncbi:hypothetical protein OAJ29_01635, partial [Euryarchaeota archaeon]|nr:hypothetical protein [Euryarchaeota archaeon]